jgi:uncharacterized protein with NRDE domain
MLTIVHGVLDGCPVLVAANREEFYSRQGTPPYVWAGKTAIMAGRDPREGGTWLGVNRHGVLVGLTNRADRLARVSARSRGLLCADLLLEATARNAYVRAMEELNAHAYAGCNILVANLDAVYAVEAGAVVKGNVLGSGIHVLTTHGVDESTDPRAAVARRWIERSVRMPATVDDWLEELKRLCGFHGDQAVPAICLHSLDRGTVSASIVAVTATAANSRWVHAQGPPCTHRFSDCSAELAQMLTRS